MTIKTIRMPTAMLAATLAALRSGKFQQGKGSLHYSDPIDGSEKFCCLGVMQMAIEGKVEQCVGLPTLGWLESKGITFAGQGSPSLEEMVKDGKTVQSPYFHTFGCSAWEANDVGGEAYYKAPDLVPKTFAEIADAWEAAAEGY